MTQANNGWRTVTMIIGTLFASWLGYFLVLFVVMLTAVWFFLNVWPR